METLNPYYPLTIQSIDEEYASLLNVKGLDKKEVSFFNYGEYIGCDYHYTPSKLEIKYGFHDGKQYKIKTIKKCTFSHCKDLKTLIIGEFVTHIDWNVYLCSSLENICVEENNTTYKSIDGVLFKGKELIAFPQGRTGKYRIPHGTRKIGNHAFKSSHISEIILANTLTEIGINAFYECRNLKEIILPTSIKKIHRNCDIGDKPIQQKFYLSDDVNKEHPFSIIEVCNKFMA